MLFYMFFICFHTRSFRWHPCLDENRTKAMTLFKENGDEAAADEMRALFARVGWEILVGKYFDSGSGIVCGV